MAEEKQLRKPSEEDLEWLKKLIERANQGDQKAMDELRTFLDENPQVWRVVGNLSRMAGAAWIKLISGKDNLWAESIKRELAELREELVDGSPGMVEKLISEQVALTLLETRYLETLSAGTAGTIGQAALLLRRLESAQERHGAALRSFVITRKLLAESTTAPRLRIFNTEQKTG